MTMEGWIDENNDDDAQEPSFISLVPGNITPPPTPSSLFPFPQPMSS